MAVACMVVVGTYAYVARLGGAEWSKLDAGGSYYSLLVDGFRAGQLSLKKEVPAGLARLPDPYDPVANRAYRDFPDGLLDLSYYKGRMYAYFGVTPALVLYWPFVAMTGRWLFDRQATTIFCSLGFLASVAVLSSMRRRYFAEVNGMVAGVCAVALGLATAVPVLLPRSAVYEVAISCGFMLVMLALGAIWCALQESESRKRWGWLAAASAAYGLAVGARPVLVFGAVIVLVPVAQAWRNRRGVIGTLTAAVGPMAIIGVGLMVYNYLRFDNPLEFGWRYALAGERQVMRQSFSARYFWFNFRAYFLEPAHWKAVFPFVDEIRGRPLPADYIDAPDPFGILANIPLVWLALAAPLAWRGRAEPAGSTLRWFALAAVLEAGMCALALEFFCASAIRYEVDFLPALMLLAVMGVLGLERALAPNADPGQASRSMRRWLARGGWGLLLAFSVVFNLLVTVEKWAYAGCGMGEVLAVRRQYSDGVRVMQRAVRMKPDYVEGQAYLGHALLMAGRPAEAVGPLERALHLRPGYAEARADLGHALLQMDRTDDAARELEKAVRARPDSARTRYELGLALHMTGHLEEAAAQYEEAVRINPGFFEAHVYLGFALSEIGSNQQALVHLEEAGRLRPDSPEVHYDLGMILLEVGKTPEAAEQFMETLRLRPNYVGAYFGLGVALEKLDRTGEAVAQYEQALRIQMDFEPAQAALTRLRQVDR